MAIIYDVENDVFFRRGVERGIKQGVKQGLEQGREEGREERETQGMDKLMKLMTLMKSDKYTLAEMAQMCDLSLEKVKSCAERLEKL